VHHLQGQTEFVTPAELQALLQEFHRETLELFNARVWYARSVEAYDANNGYQQVLGRQDVHLRWLADAIEALGGTPVEAPAQSEPGNSAGDGGRSLMESDVRSQQAFIDRWMPRVGQVTHARNRKMLELILGEMNEHLRVLQQAAEGRTDMLGRHSDGKILRGQVMAARPQN
jgi:hypothetical protein